MKKPEVWKLVLGRLLPAKSDFSRDDWRTYIHRYLLPEIQAETLRFYGETTSPEALHPGLDYANAGHRARLQVFPRHNQLFCVFDKLRLTDGEIQALCKWEGTLLAKEHFERQHKMEVKDTTWDGIQQYNKQTPSAYLMPIRRSQRGGLAPSKTASELTSDDEVVMDDEEMGNSEENGEEFLDESEDELQGSYGVELNQRLMDGTMDADWEQWMKEAIERGDVSDLLDSSHTQALRNFARLSHQSRAQILRGLGSAPLSPNSRIASYRANPERQRIDATTQVLDNDGAIPQNPRHSSQWPPRLWDQLPQASQPSGTSSSDSQSPASQASQLSNANTAILTSSARPFHSPESNHTTTPQATYWGREIPEIFSDYPRPHIAALQAQLPPPPQYNQFYPSTRVISGPAASPATAVPSATPSTSVPS